MRAHARHLRAFENDLLLDGDIGGRPATDRDHRGRPSAARRHDRAGVDVDPVVACAIDRHGALRRVDLDALPFGKVLQIEHGVAGCELELEIAGLERGDVELGRGRGADERAAPDGELEVGAIGRVERVAGSERHVDARLCPVLSPRAPERNLTVDERQARGRRADRTRALALRRPQIDDETPDRDDESGRQQGALSVTTHHGAMPLSSLNVSSWERPTFHRGNVDRETQVWATCGSAGEEWALMFS